MSRRLQQGNARGARAKQKASKRREALARSSTQQPAHLVQRRSPPSPPSSPSPLHAQSPRSGSRLQPAPSGREPPPAALRTADLLPLLLPPQLRPLVDGGLLHHPAVHHRAAVLPPSRRTIENGRQLPSASATTPWLLPLAWSRTAIRSDMRQETSVEHPGTAGLVDDCDSNAHCSGRRRSIGRSVAG